MRQSIYRKKETEALALALRFCKFSSFTERYGTNLDHPPLHEKDVAALQRCLHVVPGRYWVLADGSAAQKEARFNETWLHCVVRKAVEARA